jgi:tetratricopeptide (TPR) repeat protein
MAYYGRRHYEEAIAHLQKAIEYGGATEEYSYELGFCYAYLNKCDEAVLWFEKALEINPNSAIARQGLDYCRTLD